MQQTVDKIIAIARSSNNLGANVTTIDPDASFYEQGIDSLDALGIVLRVEEAYGIKIPDDEVENLDSINALAAYIERVAPQTT